MVYRAVCEIIPDDRSLLFQTVAGNQQVVLGLKLILPLRQFTGKFPIIRFFAVSHR